MAESVMNQPPRSGFRIRPLFVIIGLLVLALVVLVTIDVVRILEGSNQESIIYRVGDGVLNFIFNPTQRVPPESIVICRQDSACSTTQAILFSAIVLFTVITGFAYTTLLERKFIAWFQSRVGPNRVGPGGFLQPAADAVKLITKEDITPAGASWFVWFIAPMIKAVPVLIVLAVIPLGPDILVPWFDGKWYQVPLSLADPNVGVLWLLAITSLGTYGIVLAGWASNNKYAMLGGLRSSAQMISYELSLGLTMAVPVMIVGSMSLGDIANGQPMFWNWFIFQNPVAAAVLFIALLAEVSRAPFDLPEAEQELTAGFMTEYSGMKFALFMMAEYLGMIAISLIFATLYLGGFQDGFGLVNSAPILGPLVLIGKVILLIIFMVWIRATLPRIRYDRLMHFGWKVLLPLALVAVCWSAISVVVGDTSGGDPVVYGVVSGVLFILLLAFGWAVLRRGQDDAETSDNPADDPIITGEPRGIGYGILQVVGTLIAIPFGLVNFAADQIDKLANLPGATNTAPPPEKMTTAMAVMRAAKEAPALPAPKAAAPAKKAAPALAAKAEAPAAEAKPAAAKATPPSDTPKPAANKPKFDKEAMLAKIREKKAK